MHILSSLYWKISDSVENVFWLLLDSWRKPDIEFFVQLNKQECIGRLSTALSRKPTLKMGRFGTGYLSGNYFYLFKPQSHGVYWRYNPVYLVLFGKFIATNQGTHIKVWHRISTGGLLHLTIWFGIAAIILSLALAARMVPSAGYIVIIGYGIIVSLLLLAISLPLTVLISNRMGRAKSVELVNRLNRVYQRA